MYDKKLIKIGRISMGLAIIANFLPAVYVGLRYGEIPDPGFPPYSRFGAL